MRNVLADPFRTPSRATLLLLLGTIVALCLAWAGCSEGSDAGPARDPAFRSPTATATVTPTLTPEPTATPTPVEPTQAPPTPTAVARVPSQPVVSAPPAPPTAPTVGRWIDVDVSGYTVSLMDGTSIVQTIAPVGVGEQIDTGIYNSTETGLFRVYSKTAELSYDAPYDTYISHWVGFDPRLANGFHSFLKDADGNIVDARTGRISNGCIRTGDPQAIFAYAQIGMPVFVHF